MFRATGPVVPQFGRQAVALPCLAEIVSCAYVATSGSMLMEVTSPVVDQNPEAFEDAYWEVNSLRVYTPVVY